MASKPHYLTGPPLNTNTGSIRRRESPLRHSAEAVGIFYPCGKWAVINYKTDTEAQKVSSPLRIARQCSFWKELCEHFTLTSLAGVMTGAVSCRPGMGGELFLYG